MSTTNTTPSAPAAVWHQLVLPTPSVSPLPNGLLGKNRASPPSPQNREYIRVAVASRLFIQDYNERLQAEQLKAKPDEVLNLKGSSVCGCGRWRAYGWDPQIAEIDVPFGKDKPHMVGHFRCKNVWSCEHCSRARSSQTRSWLRAAFMPALDRKNLDGSLVTLTLQHTFVEDWSLTTSRIIEAYKIFDKGLTKTYKKVGSLGKLKAIEALVGANGLHIHIHFLLTHAKGVDLVALADTMRSAWYKAVSEVGATCNESGFDFKPSCVNEYIAKGETAHEMTTINTKDALSKGKSLGQLLDKAGRGDLKAGRLWLRAQVALAGLMRFHAGNLSKKLGIVPPSEWEDEERQAQRESDNEGLPPPTRLIYPLVKHLRATGTLAKRSGIAMILRSARTRDITKVVKVVEALCNEVTRLEHPVQRPFETWPDNYFEQIIEKAKAGPLTFIEVLAYIEAKNNGVSGS